MELFLVGLFVAVHGKGDTSWEFVGIFDSEEAAVEACRTDQHFVAGAMLNIDLGDEPGPFDVMKYPLGDNEWMKV